MKTIDFAIRVLLLFVFGSLFSLVVSWATLFYSVQYPSATTPAIERIYGAGSQENKWLINIEYDKFNIVNTMIWNLHGSTESYYLSDGSVAVIARKNIPGSIPKWSRGFVRPMHDDPRGLIIHETVAGWPYRAWYGNYQNLSKKTTYGFAISTSKPQSRPLVLPFRPIIAGFIYNSLMYGFITFLLWLLARHVYVQAVRSRRIGLGKCVSCKYELLGLSICPECGRKVMREQGVVRGIFFRLK